MAGQGAIGPTTGWMRHMPSHDTADDGQNADAAARNGLAPPPMNGSTAAHPHGTVAPAPGLDPVELGYSSSDSDAPFNQTAAPQPSGTAAARSDGASRPAVASVAPAPHHQHRMDGTESKMDRFRDKARSEKNEARRQLDDRRTRLKVSTASLGTRARLQQCPFTHPKAASSARRDS